MRRIRLSDADRERYGGPEWLDWDANLLTVTEAELLQEQAGVSWEAYQGWLGKGGVGPIKWAMWISLRRAGVVVDWTAFDPEILRAVLVDPEPKPEAEAKGKAPSRSTRPRRSAASGKS